ncbi:MAG: hypothetical protein HY901_12405 [Deltaproteobacteria bacterium]|nr:hypothetical protein [Deltaproteobacteria bacterium]
MRIPNTPRPTAAQLPQKAPTPKELTAAFDKILTNPNVDERHYVDPSKLPGAIATEFKKDRAGFAGDADEPQSFTVKGQRFFGYYVDDGQTTKTVIADARGKLLVNKANYGD